MAKRMQHIQAAQFIDVSSPGTGSLAPLRTENWQNSNFKCGTSSEGQARTIVDAITSKDPAKAGNVLRHHTLETEKTLLRALGARRLLNTRAEDLTMSDMEQALGKLNDLREKALLGGGRERIEKLKKKGYLTCDERVALLVDPGTFVEFSTFAGPQPAEFGPNPPYVPRDGVITGLGKVNGRNVGVFDHDKTVQGGSLGNVQAARIAGIVRKCCELKVPLIALQDSVGARIQESADGGRMSQ